MFDILNEYDNNNNIYLIRKMLYTNNEVVIQRGNWGSETFSKIRII